MTPAGTTSAPAYLGHVKNGVVVLDVQVALEEGQPVRVQPLPAVDTARAERVPELRRLFEEWNQADGRLPDAQADLLRQCLAANRGLTFRDTAQEPS